MYLYVKYCKNVFEKLFFSDTRYDLGEVGRFRLNKKLGIKEYVTIMKVERKII